MKYFVLLPKETVFESARVSRAWKEAAIQAFYHELPFSNKDIDLMRSNLNLNQNIQGQPFPYGEFVTVLRIHSDNDYDCKEKAQSSSTQTNF
jgi:hypothetical protein